MKTLIAMGTILICACILFQPIFYEWYKIYRFKQQGGTFYMDYSTGLYYNKGELR